MKTFTHCNGENGFKTFVREHTGCNLFSGKGISYRKDNYTTILRSVEGTFYYDDDLNDEKNVKYTLFGQVGDQSETEPTCNEPFLNSEKTKHIYLYSKTIDKRYVWYGKYKITGKITKQHIDIENNMRTIIIVQLQKIGEDENRIFRMLEENKFECDCGSKISNNKINISRHNVSKKHQEWLNRNKQE